VRADNPHRRLVNFTSVSGLYGAAGQPNYAAAKMGVVGLTYSCANALVKYGATANMISPGANTRMASTIPSERWDPSLDEEEHAAEHVAPAVAYIASVRSDWLNGQVIGAEGRKVSLLSHPHDLLSLFAETAWSPGSLADTLEREFRPLVDAPSPEE
jgi:NAD(P)-dependent dehydrogenase (short-subunit alcohol dehydrogenase family)